MRSDPIYHFIVAPALLLNFFLAVYVLIRDRNGPWQHDLWWAAVSLVLLLLAVTVRGYALKLQDRLIRLEERVRLSSMLSAEEVNLLSGKQLIALRFAPDNEAAGLARRTIAENLDPKTIKAAIVTWRPDHNRV